MKSVLLALALVALCATVSFAAPPCCAPVQPMPSACGPAAVVTPPPACCAAASVSVQASAVVGIPCHPREHRLGAVAVAPIRLSAKLAKAVLPPYPRLHRGVAVEVQAESVVGKCCK